MRANPCRWTSYHLEVRRPHLYGMQPDDLVRHVREYGVEMRPGEARRVLAHVITAGRDGFPEVRPVAARVAAAVESTTRREALEIVDRAVDPADGFVKLLLRSPDGALSEAVRIPLERPKAFTVCLSSQVGCAMGCAFCATGRLGLRRDLEAWEMVAAFSRVRAEAPGRLTGAVFMGQGEPFANYDAVLKAAAVLADPCGGRIKAESISISTVGMVPAMRRFARERHRYRLIVSLTSAIQARRDCLLPGVARWPLGELAGAVREVHAATGQRVTVAWVVLGGVKSVPRRSQPSASCWPACRSGSTSSTSTTRAPTASGAPPPRSWPRSGIACAPSACRWSAATPAVPQPTPPAACSPRASSVTATTNRTRSKVRFPAREIDRSLRGAVITAHESIKQSL